MKKYILHIALALITIGFICVSVWGDNWYLHRSCICYKARLSSGVIMPIDKALLGYATPKAGVMQTIIATCAHGEKLWLVVFEDSYRIQRFGK